MISSRSRSPFPHSPSNRRREDANECQANLEGWWGRSMWSQAEIGITVLHTEYLGESNCILYSVYCSNTTVIRRKSVFQAMFRPGPLSPIRRSDLTPQERGPREGERANQPGMTFPPSLPSSPTSSFKCHCAPVSVTPLAPYIVHRYLTTTTTAPPIGALSKICAAVAFWSPPRVPGGSNGSRRQGSDPSRSAATPLADQKRPTG